MVRGRLVLSKCSCLDPPAQEVLCVPVTIKILFSHLKKKRKKNIVRKEYAFSTPIPL